jgi:Na+/phosphate symporter
MSKRVMAYQLGIFIIQWGLMILGFGVLTKIVAPLRLLPSSVEFATYFNAGVKALVALSFSIIWLFIWDRQVRYHFYRRRR